LSAQRRFRRLHIGDFAPQRILMRLHRTFLLTALHRQTPNVIAGRRLRDAPRQLVDPVLRRWVIGVIWKSAQDG